MPLTELFEARIDDLRGFLASLEHRLCALRHAPEMRRAAVRTLAGLEDEDDNPHLFVLCDAPFNEPRPYAAAVQQALLEQVESVRSDLTELGVKLPPAPPRDGDAVETLIAYADELAEGLPDQIGCLALVLAPDDVADGPRYAALMRHILKTAKSAWLKFIVLEPLGEPWLVDIEQQDPSAVVQQFHFSPGEIEAKVNADLATGKLSPSETRQYTLMAGAFAASQRKYDVAEKHQVAALQMARDGGGPPDEANALYNLGNTLLAQKRLPEAEQALYDAARLGLEHDLGPLAGMALTNLGVVLHRQKRVPESVEVFRAARQTFRAQSNLAGEANALDCQAATHALAGENEAAEAAWRAALALYESVTAPGLADMRNGGRKDILTKLQRFYVHTRQKAKAKEVEQQLKELDDA